MSRAPLLLIVGAIVLASIVAAAPAPVAPASVAPASPPATPVTNAAPAAPAAAPAPSAPAAPAMPARSLERDVFVVGIDLVAGKAGVPQDVSLRSGYEDQPAWLPDGSGLLFVADGVGGKTDVQRYDPKSGAVSALTATPEAEYSPTPLADGSGFSAIRVEQPDAKDPEVYADSQRLFRYGYDGQPIGPVNAAWKRVGYHAWLDPDHLVLFLVGGGPNDLPSTLVLATASDGKQVGLAKGTGGSLGRSPEGRPTFVDMGNPNAWSIVTMLPSEAKATTVAPTVKVSGEGVDQRSSEFRWLPDGTLLMGHGNRLLRFDPKTPGAGWTTFAEFPDLPGDIFRIAVSADGKQLAFSVVMRTAKTRGIRG